MKIDKHTKESIVKEIEFVVNKMDQSLEADQKLFYFSGIYGLLQRLINLEYQPDLIHLHLVLRQTYEALFGRLQAISKGGETIVPLEELHFKKLSKITKELGKKIENREEIHDTLKKFSVLAYSTTGNGYYLRQKGLLKIQNL